MSYSAPVEFSVGRPIQQGRQPGFLSEARYFKRGSTGEYQDPWLSVLISRWVWLCIEENFSSQQGNYALLGAEHIQFEAFSHRVTSWIEV